MSAVVVEEPVAASLPSDARRFLVILPAADARRPRRAPARCPAAAALEVLAAAGAGAIALARPPQAGVNGAPLGQLAPLLGVPVVRLPTEIHAAAWVAGVASAWVATGEDGLLQRLEAVAAVAEDSTAGSDSVCGDRPPALRPAVLARWAGRAWRPCRWCRGGGVAGRCGACGVRAAVRP